MAVSIDERALVPYGWHPFFQEALAHWQGEGQEVGRLSIEYKGGYVLRTAHGELRAQASGKLRRAISRGEAEAPAVGDWVVLEARPAEGSATLHGVLPRRTRLARKAAGREVVEQVVAANVDTVLVCSAVGRDLNPRRLERYLTLAQEGGVRPVVVLTKVDTAQELAAELQRIAEVAPEVPVLPLSGLTGQGVEALASYLVAHQTVALVGSSGVGKSTLINRLLGQERQAVSGLREDGKGRHTTTHRELLPLPQGALLIDTPGMRELGLWEGEEGIQATFTDVEALAEGCRFGDCGHQAEPGCAVRAAVEAGTLEPGRLEGYLKLQRETARLNRSVREQAQARREDKIIARARHDFQKRRGR